MNTKTFYKIIKTRANGIYETMYQDSPFYNAFFSSISQKKKMHMPLECNEWLLLSITRQSNQKIIMMGKERMACVGKKYLRVYRGQLLELGRRPRLGHWIRGLLKQQGRKMNWTAPSYQLHRWQIGQYLLLPDQKHGPLQLHKTWCLKIKCGSSKP